MTQWHSIRSFEPSAFSGSTVAAIDPCPTTTGYHLYQKSTQTEAWSLSRYSSVLMPIMGFSGPRMQVFVQMVSEKRIVLVWIHSEA